METKENVMITLTVGLRDKAKSLGINISGVCERMLKKEIKRIEEEG
jgi:post-segregation antitoxin (ccd killing protein)